MSNHQGHDITVTQVWVTDDDGNRCTESKVHCDECNEDL